MKAFIRLSIYRLFVLPATRGYAQLLESHPIEKENVNLNTVNTASWMESNGEVGKINISETTYQLNKGKYTCFPRDQIPTKGKGNMNMYFVE